MPQSLSRVLVHLIFSTKDRAPLLPSVIRRELHPYLAATLANNGCPFLRAGGVDDHVHLLIGQSRVMSLAEVVELVKTASSKWIKTKGSEYHDFHWQHGYGAFSVSPSNASEVVQYIERQEEHHRQQSFQVEFRRFLQRHEIEFDERYVWD